MVKVLVVIVNQLLNIGMSFLSGNTVSLTFIINEIDAKFGIVIIDKPLLICALVPDLNGFITQLLNIFTTEPKTGIYCTNAITYPSI